MSFPVAPLKRHFDKNPQEPNGKGKRHKGGGFHSVQQPLKITPGSTVFRVLCPTSKTGGVIGKGGSIVMQIRQETGAKVRVEETVPGCDERVIVIVGYDRDSEASNENTKKVEENNEQTKGSESNISNGDNANENIDNALESDSHKETDQNNEGKEEEKVLEEESKSEKAISSAQKALLHVFERIVEEDAGIDAGDDDSKNTSLAVARLLVLSSQVGCLFGKGGSVIKQMSAESGAQIRILPRDKLPPCASHLDDLVQISGVLDTVRKALQLVSQQLLENPPRDRESFSASKPALMSSRPFSQPSQPEVFPSSNYHPVRGTPYAAAPPDSAEYHSRVSQHVPKFHEGVFPGRQNILPDMLTFRLLCVNEKVGSIIGKGGSIIKTLQLETGADIRIVDGYADSDDRIIIISAPTHPDDRISAAQDALLRVQSRIVWAVPDSMKEKTVLSRLLVSSSQIGCLLGKGGAVIAEMRNVTGAFIRIMGKDHIPKCASDNEEVVQITGEFESVQEALLQITARLREHLFRDRFPAWNPPVGPGLSDQVPPFAPYGPGRDLLPPRSYSNFESSLHKFDALGGISHDERAAFMPSTLRTGIDHIPDRMRASAPWASQGIGDGSGAKSDYAGVVSKRRVGGFGSGSQPSFITSTTVEVVVPQAIVPSIYGEEGGCLKKIRQISGAKITITVPRADATETAIIISGTPDQTHAAQSLLQAFVMSGTSSP